MSLENDWDLFIHTSNDFNHIGDFGTIFKFRPTNELTISAELLLNIGNNGDHDYQVRRGNENAGRPGISGSAINRLTTMIDYRFAPEWRIYASYTYSDAFLQRSVYSMGTQFSTITAASMMLSPTTRSQVVGGGFEFPLLIDKDLHGYTRCSYDIDQNLITNACIGLTKRFHCWYGAALAARQERRIFAASEELPCHFHRTHGHARILVRAEGRHRKLSRNTF